MDYVMHFLTLFWKVVFAAIPPTGEYHCQTLFLNTFKSLYLSCTKQLNEDVLFFKCSFQEKITVRVIHVSSYSDYQHWNPFVPVIFTQNLCTAIAFFKTLQVFNFHIFHSLLRGSDQYRLVSRYDL